MSIKFTKELTGYRAAEEGTHLRDGFLARVGAGYPPLRVVVLNLMPLKDNDRDGLGSPPQ